MRTHQPLPAEEIRKRFVIDLTCPSGLRYTHDRGLAVRFRGMPAGCKKTNVKKPYQFYHVQIRRKSLIAHRVIYFLATGIDPLNHDVDHIDRNPMNNNPSNLRLATRSQNTQNAKKYRTNSTGHRGVCWNKNVGKWQAYIGFKKKLHHLGLFATPEAAAEARRVAEIKMHAEFSAMLSKPEHQ